MWMTSIDLSASADRFADVSQLGLESLGVDAMQRPPASDKR